MFGKSFVPFAFVLLWYCENSAAADSGSRLIGREIGSGAGWFVEISAEILEDKIRGGLLTQLLGNLNGLAHENKYYNEPGNVEQYTPCLPSLIGENPLVWMLEVDGFIMDIREAPREAQEEAYQLGLIPYIPADRLEPEPLAEFETKIIQFPSGQSKPSEAQSTQKQNDDGPNLFEEHEL